MPAIATARLASPAATTAPRFPTFEGLRAVAALTVVAFHAAVYAGLIWRADGRTSTLGAWVEQLNVGVSIFFVLSGFLLFRPFVAAHLAGRRPEPVRTYLARRLVRIFPAYWLALAVAEHELHLDLGGAWDHVRYYGLLQVYWRDTLSGGLPQAWSLCTELSFYLVLPLWAALLGRVRGPLEARVRAQLLGCAAWYGLGVATRALLRSGGHAVGFSTLPANADLFALGMALAVLSTAGAAGVRPTSGLGALARTLGDLPGVAWLAAACCFAGAVSLRYPYVGPAPTPFQDVARQVLFGLVAVLLVAPGVFGPQDRGLVRRLLRARPVAFVGVVSYGIYLWHITVLSRITGPGDVARPELFADLHLPWVDGVAGPTSWGALVVWAALLATAVASASWFALERPLLARVRRGAGRPRPGH